MRQLVSATNIPPARQLVSATNIPPARQLVSATNKPDDQSTGVFSKVAGVVKDIAVGAGKSLLSTAARRLTDTTGDASPFGFAKREIVKKLPDTVKLPALGDTSIKYSGTPFNQLAQHGEDALNVFTAGAGGSAAKAIGTEALKEGLQTTAVQTAKKLTGRMLAKTLLKDFGIGAAYGLTTEAQQPGEKTATDYAKAGIGGGIFGTIAPHVIGGALKLGGRAVGAASRVAGDALDAAATKLEGAAGKTPFQAAADTASGSVDQTAAGASAEAPTRIYQPKYEAPQTNVQKAAGKAADVIRFAQAVPSKLKSALLDKYSPIETLKKKAQAAGIDVPDIHDNVQGAPYRAAGVAETRLDDYLKIRGKYGEDWTKVKEYSHYLDALDRLANGNKIAGDYSVEDVHQSLQDLVHSMTPEEYARVREGQGELQWFFDKTLKRVQESGRISPEQYDQIKAAHPNYIPHDVLDYINEAQGGNSEIAPMGTSKSFNVAKSGVEGAKGSTREIDDIDHAVVRSLAKQTLLDEKNQATASVVDAANKTGAATPLRTEERVKARNAALDHLTELRDQAEQLHLHTQLTNAQDKALVKRINDLNKEIDSLSQEAVDTFLTTEPKQGQKMREVLTTKTDERARLRAEAANTQGEREYNLVNDTKAKERLKVLTQDASTAEKDVAKAQAAFDKKATLASEGENVSGLREYNDLLRAKQKLTTILQEKDHILTNKPGAFQPQETPSAKVTVTSENVGPTARQAIEAQIKGHNQFIEQTKGRISKSEQKLATAEQSKAGTEKVLDDLTTAFKIKKGQISNVLAEARGLHDIEMKKVDIPGDLEKISYYKNGVREDWLLPKDVGAALKNMSGEEANKWLQVLNNTWPGKFAQLPGRIIRSLATSINPVFALFSNPLRDIQTIGLTTDASAGDIAHGLIKTMLGKEDPELYRLAKESGALQGSVYRESTNPVEIMNSKLAKSSLLNKIVRPDKIVEGAGQRLEEMSRIIAFKKALEGGATPQEAAKAARNATVDFGKSGSFVQVLNKVVPFLNARIQGAANIVKAVEDDPTRAARKLLWTAAYPSAVLSAYNNHYKSYQNIPDYEKRKYWIVMVGESRGSDYNGKGIDVPHYIKIPKGEAQQPVANVVDRVLNIGKKQYPEKTSDFLGNIVQDFSPVTEANILVPGIQQAIELKTNYSLFKEQQIEPDYIKFPGSKKSFKTEELPAQYHYNEATSEVAKELGNLLGWSPMKIDYVIKTGVLNDLIRMYDLPIKGFSKRSGTTLDKISELPFARTILGDSTAGATQADKEQAAQKIQAQNEKKVQRILKQKSGATAPPIGRMAK